MPDNLTDNEIIKALECCTLSKQICPKNCPLANDRGCMVNVKEYALDLINRLQSENERLKEDNEIKSSKRANIFEIVNAFERGKAEAYKECIEKVKEEIAEALESNYKARAERIEKHNVGETDEFISYLQGKIDCLRGLDDFLDNLLKELESEKQ